VVEAGFDAALDASVDAPSARAAGGRLPELPPHPASRTTLTNAPTPNMLTRIWSPSGVLRVSARVLRSDGFPLGYARESR
jgi:hypothetical protein